MQLINSWPMQLLSMSMWLQMCVYIYVCVCAPITLEIIVWHIKEYFYSHNCSLPKFVHSFQKLVYTPLRFLNNVEWQQTESASHSSHAQTLEPPAKHACFPTETNYSWTGLLGIPDKVPGLLINVFWLRKMRQN